MTTLDLSKAYDKVKRSILLQDCKLSTSRGISDMIPVCLQIINVTTKGDVTGKELALKLGPTKGSPLSPVLFLIYINDIYNICRRKTEEEVIENSLGNAEITLWPDYVAKNTEHWSDI